MNALVLSFSMKYNCFLRLFFVFLIVLTNRTDAQYRYGNELQNVDFTILTSRGGHLYSGIDNYLKISSGIYSDSDTIHIECTNGEIFADSAGLYLLIPQRPGKVRLTLYAVSDGDTNVLGYKHFFVKRIPDPRLIINNTLVNVTDTIMKRTLLECDSLAVFISNDIIGSENWFHISEFLIGYNYGGFHVSHQNLSNKLLPKTKQILEYMGPDREISIKLTVESEGKVYSQLPIYRIVIY